MNPKCRTKTKKTIHIFTFEAANYVKRTTNRLLSIAGIKQTKKIESLCENFPISMHKFFMKSAVLICERSLTHEPFLDRHYYLVRRWFSRRHRLRQIETESGSNRKRNGGRDYQGPGRNQQFAETASGLIKQ